MGRGKDIPVVVVGSKGRDGGEALPLWVWLVFGALLFLRWARLLLLIPVSLRVGCATLQAGLRSPESAQNDYTERPPLRLLLEE